jgi:hypothetical protein
MYAIDLDEYCPYQSGGQAQVKFLVEENPRNFIVSVSDPYFSRYGLIHFLYQE